MTAGGALPAGDMALIVPGGRRSAQVLPVFQNIEKMGGMAKKLAEMFIIERLGGDQHDADEFLQMRVVMAGSEPFRKTFSMVATSQGAASRLIEKAEPALMQWAASPAFKSAWQTDGILVSSKGVGIPAEKMPDDAADLEALVALGIGLANALKRG